MPQEKTNSIAIALPSLGGGGAERAMLNLAKGLLLNGYKVDLVLAEAKGQLLSEIPKEARVFDFKAKRVFLSIFAYAKYLRREKPDIIFSTPNHLNIIVLIAKLISFSHSRIIVREANVPTTSLKKQTSFSSQIVFFLLPKLYPFAKKIIAVSQDVKDELIILNPKLKSKTTVILSPVVSSEIFNKSAEEISDPIFVQQDIPIIVGMGRLHPQKDFPTLLKAFAELRKTKVAKLAIFGEGKEKGNLLNLIKQLNIEEDVRLMGFVQNPFPYLKRANVFVLSSQYEGMPNVLIQAMALQTPVVVTNCKGGMQEALNHGQFGISVPIGDYLKMAEAINRSLHLPRQEEQARYVEEKFGLNNISNQYIMAAQ